MHARLRKMWAGRRVALTGADGVMAQWTRALLAALGAEVAMPESARGSWDAGALRETILRHRAEIWICAGMPRAGTQGALRDALALLGDSLTTARAWGCRCALLMLGDAAYRDEDAPWACRETDPLGGRDGDGCAQSCLRLLAEGFRRGSWGEPLPVVVTHHGAPTCGGMPGGAPASAWLAALARDEPVLLAHPDQPAVFQHALEPVAGSLLAAGRALTLPAHSGDTWNVGAHARNWLSPRAACRVLAESLGSRSAIEAVPAPHPSRQSVPRSTRLDSEKARRLLDWRAVYDAEETLRLLASWQRSVSAQGSEATFAAQCEGYLAESGRIRD